MKQILINAIENRVFPAFVAHFANLGPRNIFNKWYKAPGIIVITNGQSDSDSKPHIG